MSAVLERPPESTPTKFTSRASQEFLRQLGDMSHEALPTALMRRFAQLYVPHELRVLAGMKSQKPADRVRSPRKRTTNGG
jgi:hypothetical protein